MTAGGDESRTAGRRPRIRVLVNPNSGEKAGIPTNSATEDEVRAAMEPYFPGLGEDLIVTESEEEAIAATRDAVAKDYEIVVAAGGDGTVGTVACELLGKETALGILPLGSVMNVARMLSIPRDLEGAAAIVATGEVRAIDVGEAKGQIFFEGGSVGLNAAVFREAQQADSDRGRYRALWAALWVLLRYRPPRMVLHLDDRVLTTRALAVAVANGPYSGLGFTVAPDAAIDDGKFDVVIFSRFSRTELIRHFVSIAFGRRRYSAKTATYRSSRARIEGVHPLPCRADGHDLGSTPVEYVARPHALRVVAPRHQTYPRWRDECASGRTGDNDRPSAADDATSGKGTLVGRVYEVIDDTTRQWLARQPMFFVATAPNGADGHVNLSPKGAAGAFRVLGPTSVAYVDLVGSGVETVAHLRENGRIVLMFCAFTGPPKIVRLHGQGRVVPNDDPEFATLLAEFALDDDARALARGIVVVEATRISDSCGFVVPRMDLVAQRDQLMRWGEQQQAKNGEIWKERYVAANNARSIDGLPGYDPTEELAADEARAVSSQGRAL